MTIIRIEKGKVTNVQLKTLRIAKVLGVAVETLLEEPGGTTASQAVGACKDRAVEDGRLAGARKVPPRRGR